MDISLNYNIKMERIMRTANSVEIAQQKARELQWKAEEDARTLMRIEEVRSDKSRFKRALNEVNRIKNEAASTIQKANAIMLKKQEAKKFSKTGVSNNGNKKKRTK